MEAHNSDLVGEALGEALPLVISVLSVSVEEGASLLILVNTAERGWLSDYILGDGLLWCWFGMGKNGKMNV